MIRRPTLERVAKKRHLMTTQFGEVYEVSNADGDKYSATVFWNHFDEYSLNSKAKIIQQIVLNKSLLYPAIQRTYDFSMTGFGRDKEIAILNENCEGGRLRDNIPYLSRNLKIINIYGISEAMRYLHDRNILYENLTTESVLLDELFHPKLTEIGYSNIFRTLEDMNKMAGMPAISAPETYIHDKYDQKSEVWSFGMIVYEILTGNIPYSGLSPFEAMEKIVANELPEIPGTIENFLKDIMLKCWSFNPDDRPDFHQISNEFASYYTRNN